jgi:hypothetical protein
MHRIKNRPTMRWHKFVMRRPGLLSPPPAPPHYFVEYNEAIVDLLNRTVKLPGGCLCSLDALKQIIDYAVEQADLFIGKG